ncbi:hypothetical protein MLD38_014235 [Melastoma candidum]|uniref:Uncharacterized protein n=1 Tax=Melastoma candidum TaxID=119954 RepID=A0ACB9RDA7_9MYRT|nr:hypothetical protein MLD38_014235 [Melastoma candidum]
MRSSSSSFNSRLSTSSRGFELLPEDHHHHPLHRFCGWDVDGAGVGPAMLPAFLNDQQDLVEVTLELDDASNNIVVRSVTPTRGGRDGRASMGDRSRELVSTMERNLSISSRIRRKFPWLRSESESGSEVDCGAVGDCGGGAGVITIGGGGTGDGRRVRARLDRSKSSAQRALKGLRFISKTTTGVAGKARGEDEAAEQWRKVERRFDRLAKDGMLSREDFGECIGMVDSKEFAVGIFDALARRKRQRIEKITKEEMYDFWSQISDQSFDAGLQIFFDMADRNEDGRITREEVQELLMLSASANKLSKLKEQAEEYTTLIMEELDPENLGYIELWQLESLLLQKDTYMNTSRPLSTASVGWSQNLSVFQPRITTERISNTLRCLILENWQRGWILLLWGLVMASLFTWRFFQYRNMAVFHVMGYCITTAKGAAETLKLNMALILLPVCRNTLTWLRSTRARLFTPFDDNINFHKIIACAIIIGIIVHAGDHLACDFPRLTSSSPEKFALVSSNFGGRRPTYRELLIGVEGITGIAMVILMVISFTLAMHRFRRNIVRLPSPFNRLTGFNAFWYSHHLLGMVYVLLLIHGNFLYLARGWYRKTTWMYLAVPLMIYLVERILRACRSNYYAVQILKVAVLPGDVFSIMMSKPQGFKYKSGQYIFLQCPTISSFEWHPFSITSAPGDDFLSVHIRTVGDWTEELKRVFTEGDDPSRIIGRSKFSQLGQPRLRVDGPYGAPAQDYRNYDVLLLVGLGIGATPFISILKDLLNSTRNEDPMLTDSTTETTGSNDSSNSYALSNVTPGRRKRPNRTRSAHFYWVTRESCSFEWFKGVMDEIADMDLKGQIELHNHLTSVYEEGDARSTLITMVQALNHAKHGYDILSGTRVRTHFGRPNWREVFIKVASKHPYSTVGVFYCGMPVLAKELKKLSHHLSHKTSTRFEFHKELF